MCYTYTVKNKLSHTCQGQSVIEYILLVVAVVTFMIVFLSPTGGFKKTLDSSFTNAFVRHLNNVNKEIQF